MNDYLSVLENNNIHKLYHFTDRDNLESIINNGGLYSWQDCLDKNIKINRPGGSDVSHSLDKRDNLQDYVRLSYTRRHPMMYAAMQDGRLSNPVILEISTDILKDGQCIFSDRNAVKNGAIKGKDIDNLKSTHFSTVLAKSVFDIPEEEREYYQAEVLVKNYIPIKYILNISSFGIQIPTTNNTILKSKTPYTAQISREHPTAFIFLVDQSASMKTDTVFNGETMSRAEAVSRIVNRQIYELVLRCIKENEIRHYYDIAVVGYGHDVHSGWMGRLSDRYFVSPKELYDNPYRTIWVNERKKTRKGIVTKSVEKYLWIEPGSDGRWTHMYEALSKAYSLAESWIINHEGEDVYPPTIINISDGDFNDANEDSMLQISNDIKSLYTNDGNVILFNIHISSQNGESFAFPIDKTELGNNYLGKVMFSMSSLLPMKYNSSIAKYRNDCDETTRHVGIAVNADMTTLVQLMDIGTPTNIEL